MHKKYYRLQIEEQRRKEEEAKKHHEELVAKHRETRMRVIQEVLQTEKDYLHSISLCQDVFSDKVNRVCVHINLWKEI